MMLAAVLSDEHAFLSNYNQQFPSGGHDNKMAVHHIMLINIVSDGIILVDDMPD